MKILIVTEKPSMSRALAPHVRAHWPNDEIAFVNAVPFANLKFSYPRGGRLSDYPSVADPVYRLANMEKWVCPPFIMDAAGELTQVPMDLRYFKEADLIVQACDPDHRGAITFEGIMAQVFGDNRALNCPSLRLIALDDESIRKALSNLRPFGESSEASLAYGHVKDYFDFNFNVNALAVLGAVIRQTGAGGNAPPLSKFSLQLLYSLSDSQGMTAGQLVRLMSTWKGTGKYPYRPGAWNAQLGGVASRSQIIENLTAAGLLEVFATTPQQLRISARGLQLLESLHPDCRDLDLPFRIEAWGLQGLAAAKPSIDKYIRTFFGKQLRFSAKKPYHA